MGAPARFITFEGGEGAGKSTQIALLAESLRTRAIPVVTTREPGGTPGAEAIRSLLVTGATDRWPALAEALLHFAARADHLERVIRPALARGEWVLCDRFSDSSMAYQGYAQGLGRPLIEMLDGIIVRDTRPHLTIILDVDARAGLARAGGEESERRYERMGEAFHEVLRAAFRDIAAREPARCLLVDSSRPREVVAQEILAAVGTRLGLGEGGGDGP